MHIWFEAGPTVHTEGSISQAWIFTQIQQQGENFVFAAAHFLNLTTGVPSTHYSDPQQAGM
jgi:hypothetical protein